MSKVQKKEVKEKAAKKKKIEPWVKEDYRGVRITISVKDFDGATKGKLEGKASSEMKDVKLKLKEYHIERNDTHRNALLGACFVWKANCSDEFEALDAASGGVVRKLAVQAGCFARGDQPPAVMFKGFKPERHKETFRLDPGMTSKSRSALKTMKEYRKANKKFAVIVIDLYGDDFEKCGLLCKFPPGGDNPTNKDTIKEFLHNTKDTTVYICSKKKKVKDKSTGKRTWRYVQLDAELVEEFDSCIPGSANKQYIYSHTNCTLVGTFKDDDKTMIEDLKENNINDVFVVGFDANSCVAATIFGSTPVSSGVREYPGLCDYGINVVTSERLVGAGGSSPGYLQQEHGWPYLGSCSVGSYKYF